MGSLSPLKAIRAWCLECSCGVRAEVRNCTMLDCPLYPFRMGKNPNRKRKTEESTPNTVESENR